MTSRSSVSRTSSAIASCGHVVPRREPIISSPKPPVSPPAIWWSMWTMVLAVSRGYSPSRRLARPMIALKSITPKATSFSCRSRTSIFCRATASEETKVDLDRLGGGNWQARKARMKSRIREIAGELIKIAAERQLREAPRLAVGPGAYDEFCAGFPYEETDDQLAAIDATIKDLGSGRPMDRLDLRRCRFRQDRSGIARRLHRGHRRQAGCGGRADDAAGSSAFQDVLRAFPRLSGECGAGVAAGAGGRAGAKSGRVWPTATWTS